MRNAFLNAAEVPQTSLHNWFTALAWFNVLYAARRFAGVDLIGIRVLISQSDTKEKL